MVGQHRLRFGSARGEGKFLLVTEKEFYTVILINELDYSELSRDRLDGLSTNVTLSTHCEDVSVGLWSTSVYLLSPRSRLSCLGGVGGDTLTL